MARTWASKPRSVVSSRTASGARSRGATAREESVTRPEFEEGVETAYQDIRDAFEQWIRLTAIDTLGAAVASHLDEDDELEFDDDEAE